MFASQRLAARIDRAEGQLCGSIAGSAAAQLPQLECAVLEIGGGLAIFAGPGAPTNKMIGIGFDGPPNEAELNRVEQAFAERSAPLQAEVSTLAEPTWHACLVRRGYEPRGFENVLGHPLTAPASQAGVAQTESASVSIERVDAGHLDEWIEIMVAAFGHADEGGVGGDAVPPADTLRQWLSLTMATPGFNAVAARAEGRMVAGASMRVDQGLAQFCGAATLPAFRRRGLQTALVRWRLAQARALGCDVAVVTTQPASRSQQNLQTQGFDLLYTRQLLVKMP